MKFLIVLAGALAMGSSISLAADDAATDSKAAAQTGTRHGACSGDIQKFCAGVERGKGKIRECLSQHTADLSDGCKQRIAEHAAKKAAPAN